MSMLESVVEGLEGYGYEDRLRILGLTTLETRFLRTDLMEVFKMLKGEVPIYTTTAHVFQIDPETKKKWLPVSSQAVAVSYYHDSSRNTFRIISMDGNKPIINSSIKETMSFSKTSQKFGQWVDPRAGTVYGLGFSSEADLAKFSEKFNEVKEKVKAVSQKADPPLPAFPSVGSGEINGHSVNASQSNDHTSCTSTIDQLKYENDKLKIALAQSSTNASKWESDLGTLRNNNARLTAALQESSSNVEEWKKQLTAYKDECTRMKTKIAEMERSNTGSDQLQRQLNETKEKLKETERVAQTKQDELMDLKRKYEEAKQLESQSSRLNAKLQTAEEEKLKLRKQVSELQQQLDQSRSNKSSGRQQLQTLQQQLSSKINELYEMNDKLADVLQVVL